MVENNTINLTICKTPYIKTNGLINHNDLFDDSQFTLNMKEVKIHEIKIYEYNKIFVGIQVFYVVGNQIVTPGLHGKFDLDNKEISEKSIILSDDEYINLVEVHFKSSIHFLRVVSNKTREISSTFKIKQLTEEKTHSEYKIRCAEGEYVVAFSGSLTEDNQKYKYNLFSHLSVHIDSLPKRF